MKYLKCDEIGLCPVSGGYILYSENKIVGSCTIDFVCILTVYSEAHYAMDAFEFEKLRQRLLSIRL